MHFYFSIFPFFVIIAGTAPAQTSDTNEIICMAKFNWAAANHLQTKPIGDLIAEVGKSFIGTDYAAHTLESAGEEKLIVDLQTLDCVTFYENSLVLARCIKKGTATFDDYKKELQLVRYRGGKIRRVPEPPALYFRLFLRQRKKGNS